MLRKKTLNVNFDLSHQFAASRTYHRLQILVPDLDAKLVSSPTGGATEDVLMSYHAETKMFVTTAQPNGYVYAVDDKTVDRRTQLLRTRYTHDQYH